MWLLIKDAWRARSIKDKLLIWFMPTGWRPADVDAKYPVYKIEDVYHFEKYDTKSSTFLSAWTWVQLVMLLLLVSYFFGNIATIGSPNMFIYGGFVFVYVYALTELMDGNKYAIGWEFFKATIGITVIFSLGDWFGAGKFFPWISYVLIAYFILSAGVTGWLVYASRKEETGSLTISV